MTNGKNQFILWNLSPISMKILNDIVCNLNRIQIPKFNSIQFNCREMECKLVWKVLKICPSWLWFWIIDNWKDTYPKNTFSFLFPWEWVLFPILELHSKGQFMEPKVTLLKLGPMRNCHWNYCLFIIVICL